jgi:hypothetical protein
MAAMSDLAAAVISKANGHGPSETVEIREVWADNLEAEFALIRDVVDEFPFVAMDTEFPGIVCRPVGTAFRSPADYNYATLKANVDMLHLIQLGLTFSSPTGELPALGPGPSPSRQRRCVWQFNFREFDDARGLNKLAELLDVERVGESHQAGSDSLVTSCAFWKLKDSFFAGSTEKYAGVLYGLNAENGVSAH